MAPRAKKTAESGTAGDGTNTDVTDPAPEAVDPSKNDRGVNAGAAPVDTLAPRQYGSGEGYEAGNVAPANVYRDEDTGKFTTDEPERGTLVAAKGDVVQPGYARMMEEGGFKG